MNADAMTEGADAPTASTLPPLLPEIEAAGRLLIGMLRDAGPSREMSVAITNIETGLLWARKGMTR